MPFTKQDCNLLVLSESMPIRELKVCVHVGPPLTIMTCIAKILKISPPISALAMTELVLCWSVQVHIYRLMFQQSNHCILQISFFKYVFTLHRLSSIMTTCVSPVTWDVSLHLRFILVMQFIFIFMLRLISTHWWVIIQVGLILHFTIRKASRFHYFSHLTIYRSSMK